MGIRGLTGYISKLGIAQRRIFSLSNVPNGRKSNVIIDGSSFIHYVFVQSCNNWTLGGEYVEFISCLSTYIHLFRLMNIETYFVFDGLIPADKQQTKYGRQNQNLSKILSSSLTPADHVMPDFAYFVAIKYLSSVCTNVYVADDCEADELILCLAEKLRNAHVLSNDSDFYLHTSIQGFFPLREFYVPQVLFEELRQGIEKMDGKCITVMEYKATRLAKYLRIDEDYLSLFGCLVGNDYLKLSSRVSIDQISNAIRILQNDIKDYCDFRDFTKRVLCQLNILPTPSLVDMILKAVDAFERSNGNLKPFKSAIPRKFANFIKYRDFYCTVDADPLLHTHKSSWMTSFPLRQFIYTFIDLRMDNPLNVEVIEHRSNGACFSSSRAFPMDYALFHSILPSFALDCQRSKVGAIQKLCNMKDIPPINHLPLIASILFIKDSSDFSFHFYYSLISAYVESMLTPASTMISGNANISKHLPELRHFLCTFQTVLLHVLMIMDCLELDISVESLGRYYNGELIVKQMKKFELFKNDDSWMQSPQRDLYHTLGKYIF